MTNISAVDFLSSAIINRNQDLGELDATAKMVENVDFTNAQYKWGVKKTPSYLVSPGSPEYDAFVRRGYVTPQGVWGWSETPLPVGAGISILTSKSPEEVLKLEDSGEKVKKDEEGGFVYDESIIWTNENFVIDGPNPTFVPLPECGPTAYAKAALVLAVYLSDQSGKIIETTEGDATVTTNSVLLFEWSKKLGRWVPYVQEDAYFKKNYKIV